MARKGCIFNMQKSRTKTIREEKMAKITFIGAGSLGFTRGLVRDILTFPRLKNSTICLMDINPERLEFARKACQMLVDRNRVKAKVEATLDRKKALKGADVVMCT